MHKVQIATLLSVNVLSVVTKKTVVTIVYTLHKNGMCQKNLAVKKICEISILTMCLSQSKN